MKARDLLFIVNKEKNRIANLGVYFCASLIPMLLSLIANPFLAKNLSPTDYAIIGYFTAFNTLFGPLVNFYLLHYFTKRFYELDTEGRIKLKATLYRLLIWGSLLLTVIAVGSIVLYTILFNADSDIPLFPYVLLSIIPLPLTGIYSLSLVEYRMARESKKFFFLSVGNSLLSISLSLILVVWFKTGAIGKLSATIISSGLVFIYILIKNKSIWQEAFDRKTAIDSILFCWPLVLASMLTFFCTGYDKVFLERTVDVAQLGIYAVGTSIASYMSVFSSSINDTFQPDIFESIVKRQYNRCVKIVFVKLLLLTVFVGAFIILAPFVINILTAGRYVNSVPYARIVSISSLTSMLYYSFSQITVALGLTKITLSNKIIGSILSIISFNILITKWGAVGAAWGIVFSYLYFFLGNVIMVVYYKKRKT